MVAVCSRLALDDAGAWQVCFGGLRLGSARPRAASLTMPNLGFGEMSISPEQRLWGPNAGIVGSLQRNNNKCLYQ